ncbi:kinesin-like protein [Coniosporium apollinis]|uniref:Kinesin-like protein n=1 Tax=Coniosporium apollinis TaxID=61459 RepID=A0ABQ9NGX4_9PEZI|nr:kinesin-like protein [Coniosporium apollinis]
MAPSTFASAAAGNNANSTRADGGGDWPRRTNGATQTFRRPSHATTLSASSQSRDTPSGAAGVYIPPHRSGPAPESRYSRDQLLQLFKAQKEAEGFGDGLSALYVGGWQPYIANGTSSNTWGRREDHGKENHGADVCWDRDGTVQPLGLAGMTEEEKEHFSTSVNSPLKPPTQNNNKEGTSKDGLSLRKTSISQAQNSPSAFGLSSPTTTRPGNRRRETSDAYPFPSPSTSRFSREDSSAATPPPALLRRRTDLSKESISVAAAEDKDKDKEKPREGNLENTEPFSNLKRSTTQPLSAGLNGPSSPWSSTPQATGFTPMGAFGSFALGPTSGQASAPTDKKSGFGSVRGASRFKDLMTKESSEDLGKSVKEKASLGSLGKVNEENSDRQTLSWMEARSNRQTSNDTDPFPDDENVRSGSAALGGAQDSPPRRQAFPGLGTPSRQESKDESAFSAFGMSSDIGFRDLLHGRDPYQHQTPQHRNVTGAPEPMSPTDTNPYRSPEHERGGAEDVDADEADIQHTHLPGLGGFTTETVQPSGMLPFSGLGGLGRVSAPYEAAASDRSQTSSVGPSRGFPSLGGLGGLPGLGGSAAWPPAPQQSIGTPIRDRAAFGGPFGEGAFGSVGELQSPSLAGLGSSSVFGPNSSSGLGGTGTIGRSSKMGSLFPAAMQEQMRAGEQARQMHEEGSIDDDRHQPALAPFGRNAFGSAAPGGIGPARETESPFRTGGRGILDDLLGSTLRGAESHYGGEAVGSPIGQPPNMFQSANLASVGQGPIGTQRSVQPPQPQSVGSSASSQPPAAQQRTMVMPDRMRWIYRDPQGNTQGPWSGLEMHDWYKAGFFSPELLVKKYEDPDYEPLAQLIRRIGNSREPFLVPQIGIPHGPPTTQVGNVWAGPGPLPSGPTSSSAAQPPFASSFPSFGTTLTADQQNALERRKQEEQYLMARQKEHLAQQQVMAKQMQLQGQHGMVPQQLHHHSSAHSLHSQPSFGSITSPGGYQPSPTQGPLPGSQGVPGFFDNSFRAPPVPGVGPIGSIREEDMPSLMEQLNLGGRGGQARGGVGPLPFGLQQQPEPNMHAQQVAAMLNDRSRLQREQAEQDSRMVQNEQQTAQGFADRLQQFQELRGEEQRAQDISAPQLQQGVIGKQHDEIKAIQDQMNRTRQEVGRHQLQAEELKQQKIPQAQNQAGPTVSENESSKMPEALSLTEQVKAASAKQSPVSQSPWAKIDTALPQPFPPPQSSSPLPAPAAQRKQNLADALNEGSRSRSETPSVDTPSASIAPWAKEPSEAPKGPSLKEIQEAEARKAAQQEELAAAARKAALEKEMFAQATQQPPAPGLPSSSTWASTASPVNPTASTPSAWTKPIATKPASTATPTKKTLQQIQKEEEARKQRAAAAAASVASAVASPAQALATGKRYAELAKQAAPSPSNAGGAWTTVGASGKVKTPAAAVPTAPAAAVKVSSSVTTPSAAAKPKPAPVRSVTSGQVNAQEEFRKWAVAELKGDISAGINVNDFITTLVTLGSAADIDIITESVHAISKTIDSRHFAEEFVRRRKLADKGVVESSGTASPAGAAGAAENKTGGGWSEVAKKGPLVKEKEEISGYKVVPAKKKGGKR